jgi:transposase
VAVAFVDQGYTGEEAAHRCTAVCRPERGSSAAAEAEGIALCVVKVEGARRGFVLLPKRWVVERSFAWTSRFRRLARDYERLAETLRGWHWLTFSVLMTVKNCGAFTDG